MVSPEKLLRRARAEAGLTQAQLAERMGTTQSAVARLESPGANPRVESLERALLAAGHRLELRAEPAPQPLDETLIASSLRRTPAERLAELDSLNRDVRRMTERSRRG